MYLRCYECGADTFCLFVFGYIIFSSAFLHNGHLFHHVTVVVILSQSLRKLLHMNNAIGCMKCAVGGGESYLHHEW